MQKGPIEVRARQSRHKDGLNFGPELKQLLHGAGAPAHPDVLHPLDLPASNPLSSQTYLRTLPTANKHHPPSPFANNAKVGTGDGIETLPEPYPETLRVLDEMVTDFVIEACHQALNVATYSGRAKLKLADWEWVMRRDRRKLGRAQEMFKAKKKLEKARREANAEEGGNVASFDIRKMQVRDMQDLGDIVGEEGTGKGKGKGRGRRKKREAEEMEDAGAGAGAGAGGEGSLDGAPAMSGALRGGTVDVDGLDDIDVDIDNDLEAVDEEDTADRHRNKKARSEVG